MDGETRVEQLAAGPVEYRITAGPDRRSDVVVVLHGGHMRADLPVGESALLERGHTLLVPSRPGYGRTPLSSGPSPERFADATAELCARLGITSVPAVVGVSAGGPTAVALAARHPRLVRSLVLHSARSSLPFPSGAPRLAAPVLFHPRLESLTWSAIHHLMRRSPEAGLTAMMSSLSTLPARRVVDDLTTAERREVAGIFASMRSGAGFVNDVRQPVDPGFEREVAQPTLIVASRTDGQVRWEHALSLERHIPGSVLWESPSLSHLIWYGSGAAATARRTASFLAER